MLSQRWAYHQVPDELPTVQTRVVPFDEVLAQLPAETRRVTPEERRQQVRVRQAHTQLRYRQS